MSTNRRTFVSCFLAGAVVALAGCSDGPTDPTPLPVDPPVIACPAPVTQISATALPIAATYGNPTVTGGATPITTSCAPASGTLFPVGLTQVTCTATDTRQQSSACTFTVRIQKPAEISMTRFVAFGDSITLGEDGFTPPTVTSIPKTLTEAFVSPMQILFGQEYPTVLQKLLAARYSTQTIVVHNEGERGERAALGPLRFGDVLARRLPQAVLIMEGSNDIFSGDTTQIAPAIAGLRSMIITARGRGVQPYLATVPPMNPAGFRGRQGYATVPLLNAQIKSLAQLEAVPLVDINLAFNGNFAYLASDGLHPNASGFDLIGQTFFTSLRNTLEVAPPTLEPLSSTASFGLR